MQDAILRDELFMTLFEAALPLAAQERAEYVRQAAAGDVGLAAEVLDALHWYAQMGNFLAEPLFAPPETKPPFEPGTLLNDRFRLVKIVGEGGMAFVYEARDEKLRKPCAIKCAKPGFEDQLTSDADGGSLIPHKNVCRIFDLHSAHTPSGKLDFLSMEYINGNTLADVLLQRGRLPHKEALSIALQLCEGLAMAHSKKVLHRDLKPNNIMITGPAETPQAIIMDFGLSTQPRRKLAVSYQSGLLWGVADYIAPELLVSHGSGRLTASPRSDLYALGVILYEMVTGRLPFEGLNRRTDSLPEPPDKWEPSLHWRWNKAILGCLQKNPEDRPATADEVAAVLTGSRWKRAYWAASIALAAGLGIVFPSVQRSVVHLITPESEPARLAMLPGEVSTGDSDLQQPLNDSLQNTAHQLYRLKLPARRLIVIPMERAIAKNVSTPERAGEVLNATHAMKAEVWRQAG